MKRGFAIMLVLMMLFLLFMLGVAFFFSAWTHAFMARNYLNMKRAFVVAEGGVHHAIGNIIGDFSWVMHAQNKGVNARSNLGWEWGWYRGTEAGDFRIPPEYATHPSYAMLVEESRTQGCICSTGGNPCPTPSCDCTMGQRLCPGKTTALYEPKKITILGQEVGLSGVMDPGGGAYGINSDIFHLKVTECSAQLYVNEGLGHPYNTAVMQRILNNLADQLDLDIRLGDKIIQKRPPDGYKTKFELREKLGKELYNKVKDFLCVATWSDNKVANPVPLSDAVKDVYDAELFQTPGHGIRGNARYTRFCEDGQPAEDVIIYSQRELIPTHVEVTRRAPVNINTAPRQILIALLRELEGFFVIGQQRASNQASFEWQTNLVTHVFSYPCSPPTQFDIVKVVGDIGVVFRTTPIKKETAEQLAYLIMETRPFRTWGEFERFIDQQVWHFNNAILEDHRGAEQLNIIQTPLYTPLFWDHYKFYASQAMADVIKANFNPNLHLNELNPDATLWRWVDKTDLITNSTEFCFLPTGYFEIESVGRILRAEWEPGRFHISPYLLIMKDSFQHNNQIMGQRRLKVVVRLWDIYRETSQKDFYQGNFSPNGSQFPTSGNWGCESGPVLNNGALPFEIEYEGYVTLATSGGSLPLSETRLKGKVYSRSPEPVPPTSEDVPEESQFIPDHFDLIDVDRRDGFYADKDTTRCYWMRIPDRGTFCYWLKPGLMPQLDGYTRTISSINRSPSFNVFEHQMGWTEGMNEEDYPETWFLPISMRFRYECVRFFSSPVGDYEIPAELYLFPTPTLNHLHHNCTNGPARSWYKHTWQLIDSPFLAHRWIHVAIWWSWEKRGEETLANGGVWINGKEVSTMVTYKNPAVEPQRLPTYHDEGKWILFLNQPSGKPNPFTLGGDRWSKRPSHCTIDEFYFVELRYEKVPCGCGAERRCKGGPGVACLHCSLCKRGTCTRCSQLRKCKGGQGELCWCKAMSSYFACQGKGGSFNCPWWCMCGGNGRTEECTFLCSCRCGGGCPCSAGLTPGCEIKKTGLVPCRCHRNRRCKGGRFRCLPVCKCGGTGKVDGEVVVTECECGGTGKTQVVESSDKLRPQWLRGRYYRQNDATFTSGEIDLCRITKRLAPIPNEIRDPYGGTRWRGNEGLSQLEAREWVAQTWYSPELKILGLTWTVYTEGIIDYSQPDAPLLSTQLELSLERKGKRGHWLQVAGPFLNAGSGWAPVMVKLGASKIRYRVRFNTRCDPENAILLETPVLDDVTIYWATRPQFVSWVESY